MKSMNKFTSEESRSALFLLIFTLVTIALALKIGPYITLYAESNQIKDCKNYEVGEVVKVNSNLITPSKIINGYTATYCNSEHLYEEYKIESSQFKLIKENLSNGSRYYIDMIK